MERIELGIFMKIQDSVMLVIGRERGNKFFATQNPKLIFKASEEYNMQQLTFECLVLFNF
jgi:hypothetical protein